MSKIDINPLPKTTRCSPFSLSRRSPLIARTSPNSRTATPMDSRWVIQAETPRSPPKSHRRSTKRAKPGTRRSVWQMRMAMASPMVSKWATRAASGWWAKRRNSQRAYRTPTRPLPLLSISRVSWHTRSWQPTKSSSAPCASRPFNWSSQSRPIMPSNSV